MRRHFLLTHVCVVAVIAATPAIAGSHHHHHRHHHRIPVGFAAAPQDPEALIVPTVVATYRVAELAPMPRAPAADPAEFNEIDQEAVDRVVELRTIAGPLPAPSLKVPLRPTSASTSASTDVVAVVTIYGLALFGVGCVVAMVRAARRFRRRIRLRDPGPARRIARQWMRRDPRPAATPPEAYAPRRHRRVVAEPFDPIEVRAQLQELASRRDPRPEPPARGIIPDDPQELRSRLW